MDKKLNANMEKQDLKNKINKETGDKFPETRQIKIILNYIKFLSILF